MGRNPNHMTSTNHPSTMQTHNMGSFRQQVTPFTPGMNPNSAIGPSSAQMAPGYPAGPGDGVMDGLENVFPIPQSPNVDLNLINDFMDGN